jgi:hypothetical protein
MSKCFHDIHLGLSFVQKWRILMEQTRAKVDMMVSLVAEQAKSFKPQNENLQT